MSDYFLFINYNCVLYLKIFLRGKFLYDKKNIKIQNVMRNSAYIM